VHVQQWLFRSFLSKNWTRHLLWWPQFPMRQMHFHSRVTYMRYIWCFCATKSRDLLTLWPWPLSFWPWHCFLYCASHAWPTHQFCLSYGYPLLSYELLNLITFLLAVTVIRMSQDLSLGRGHIFEIANPNLPIHFITFRALYPRLSHVITKK